MTVSPFFAIFNGLSSRAPVLSATNTGARNQNMWAGTSLDPTEKVTLDSGIVLEKAEFENLEAGTLTLKVFFTRKERVTSAVKNAEVVVYALDSEKKKIPVKPGMIDEREGFFVLRIPCGTLSPGRHKLSLRLKFRVWVERNLRKDFVQSHAETNKLKAIFRVPEG